MDDGATKKLAELEALLFIHGEPLGAEEIMAALKMDKTEMDNLLKELDRRLGSEDRGLALVFDEDKVQLATKPEFGRVLEQFMKEELSEELTPASLEALAVVSYLGPISRSRIEYLRGVNSSFILRSLLLRGLVERFPDPERPNAFLYRPTFDLLKHLGLKNVRELPDYEKFQPLLGVFGAEEAAGTVGGPARTAENVRSGGPEEKASEAKSEHAG